MFLLPAEGIKNNLNGTTRRTDPARRYYIALTSQASIGYHTATEWPCSPQPRGISSVGRAIGSQSIGQGFESPILHNKWPALRRAIFVVENRGFEPSERAAKRRKGAMVVACATAHTTIDSTPHAERSDAGRRQRTRRPVGPRHEVEGRKANPLFSTLPSLFAAVGIQT